MDLKKQVVIRIVGLINGQPTAYDGQFLVEYDPSRDGAEPGTGRPMLAHIVTTPDLDKATRWEAGQALEVWRAVDSRNPVRPDGKPNRPLTAFSVEIAAPEDVLPL